ncbi:MAG: HAD family hydrolase [Hyphomicrobiales bacterium]|nr:HAD family hydrolase [Hyphomicrobiales bacterium]MCP5374051.1 HAD family hydrolase [Hyphomicrobiales bacterium]
MPRLRGILFDKDGTLLDYDATWNPAYAEAAREVAGGDAALALRLLVETGWDAVAARARPGSLLAAATNDEIGAAWGALLPAARQRPDMGAWLDRIFMTVTARTAVALVDLPVLFAGLRRRGLALGLATNDSQGGARASLAAFGVVGDLDFLAGFDSGHGGKPDPGMVFAFCRRIDAQPSEIAVVGDNIHDLEMGRSAGAGLVVGVLSGNGTAADLDSHADHLIGGVGDLADLLDRLEGRHENVT